MPSRIDPDSFKPIVLPPDWDEQKDCAYFEDRWDPEPSYTQALWRMARFHGGNFQKALDSSLYYFQYKDARLVRVEPLCLSSFEKIETLWEIAQTSPCVAHFQDRLQEDLRLCEVAETERRRVLKEYRLAGDQAWMYPVVELIDCLGNAAFLLNETMMGENDDFQQVMRERLEEPEDDF